MESSIRTYAEARRKRAFEVLRASRIADTWREAGCRVSLVGSLRMGLLVRHRDIDLHVYSPHLTTGESFRIMARVAADERVAELRCINGLHTDEHCVAWHVRYRADDGQNWQFDIIHIEEGTRYDGFFERMADRIVQVASPRQTDTILRLKYETPEGEEIHGVEYYEAVIADGVQTLDELRRWLPVRRAREPYYWMP